jgi:polar amino acid transport system substrate-binding protein
MKLHHCLACCLLAWSSPAALGQEITVSWRDKPPYHYVDGEQGRGFLLARGKRVFAAAGVPAQFVMEPSKRIWASFQSGKTNYCSLGRYKMPERDAFAQYTRPIQVDPPQVLLVAEGALPKVKGYKSLAALLAEPGFELGLTDGTSLGPQLDALVAGSANTVTRRTVDASTLIRMVAAGSWPRDIDARNRSARRSAPARLKAIRLSIITLSWSSQPFWAAALSIAYSPLTW